MNDECYCDHEFDPEEYRCWCPICGDREAQMELCWELYREMERERYIPAPEWEGDAGRGTGSRKEGERDGGKREGDDGKGEEGGGSSRGSSRGSSPRRPKVNPQNS